MKAQVVGRIFIYVVSLVVMSMILLYGYKAVHFFLERGDDINLLHSKTEAKKAIEEIMSQSGSVKQIQIPIPTKYSQVCFVDLEQSSSALSKYICTAGNEFYHPLICDSWQSNTKQNFFLVESKTRMEPFYLGNIAVDGNDNQKEDTDSDCAGAPELCYNLCLGVNKGKITFWIMGLGDRTLVSLKTPS